MKKITFIKSNSNGNNFVVVDEIQSTLIIETEKPIFARQTTNLNYGVGADAYLALTRCTQKNLETINHVNNYWKKLPSSEHADYIFRIFEPTGEESFSCGNGLICIAKYLFQTYQIAEAKILIEIPTKNPKIITIGTNKIKDLAWVNIGEPSKLPFELTRISQSGEPRVDIIQELPISFRQTEMIGVEHEDLLITGYLIYTGEPHLVLFSSDGFSRKDLFEKLFIGSHPEFCFQGQAERRIKVGSWLIQHIGNYLNRKYKQSIFPFGINIDFAQVLKDSNTVEYRCFERGINQETFSCGTGALAVAYLAHIFGFINKNPIKVWPHRCRLDDPQAEFIVEKKVNEWLLFGNPSLVCKGEFHFRNSASSR